MSKKVRIPNFEIEGTLADAFIEEMREQLISKSALTRAALVEYLRNKGYEDAEDTTAPWGGFREEKEDESEDNQEAVALR
jgi:hypothetical protein